MKTYTVSGKRLSVFLIFSVTLSLIFSYFVENFFNLNAFNVVGTLIFIGIYLVCSIDRSIRIDAVEISFISFLGAARAKIRYDSIRSVNIDNNDIEIKWMDGNKQLTFKKTFYLFESTDRKEIYELVKQKLRNKSDSE